MFHYTLFGHQPPLCLSSRFGSVVQGVVIGYDHRALGTLSSKSFARISAAVFLSAGYKVLSIQLSMFTTHVSDSLLLWWHRLTCSRT
jgi:hypothetical protein